MTRRMWRDWFCERCNEPVDKPSYEDTSPEILCAACAAKESGDDDEAEREELDFYHGN